jgi:hypothetical protein
MKAQPIVTQRHKGRKEKQKLIKKDPSPTVDLLCVLCGFARDCFFMFLIPAGW